LIRESKTLSI